jgi:hypothetical protein
MNLLWQWGGQGMNEKGLRKEGTGHRSRGLWSPGFDGNRGWRVVQPGSMCVVVSESRTAHHARFVSADLEASQIGHLRSQACETCGRTAPRPTLATPRERAPHRTRMSVAIAQLRRIVKNKMRTSPAPAVMAGLVPAIHVFERFKTWIPGTSPGMTREGGTPSGPKKHSCCWSRALMKRSGAFGFPELKAESQALIPTELIGQEPSSKLG